MPGERPLITTAFTLPKPAREWHVQSVRSIATEIPILYDGPLPESSAQAVALIVEHSRSPDARFTGELGKYAQIESLMKDIPIRLRNDLLLMSTYCPTRTGRKQAPIFIFRGRGLQLLSVIPTLKDGIQRRPITDIAIPGDKPPTLRVIPHPEDLPPSWVEFALHHKALMGKMGVTTEEDLRAQIASPAVQLSLTFSPKLVEGRPGDVDLSKLQIEDVYTAVALGSKENPAAVLIDLQRHYRGDEGDKPLQAYLQWLATSEREFRRAAWLNVERPYEGGAFGQGERR